MFTVRVRFPDMKRFTMVTPKGYTTSRRVHAAMFPSAEECAPLVAAIQSYSPDIEVKIGKL